MHYVPAEVFISATLAANKFVCGLATVAVPNVIGVLALLPNILAPEVLIVVDAVLTELATPPPNIVAELVGDVAEAVELPNAFPPKRVFPTE